MIGSEMREFSEEETKFQSKYVEDDIKQYVEDRTAISGPRRSVHLWEFLLELLMDESYSSMIQWTDEINGEFKLKSSEDVARKWGQRKHKEGMNYDKLSRALRYYYSKNIIKKVSGRRFVYKFVPSPEMHAAVNAIKTHMIRGGRKHVPAGPFPHFQSLDISQLKKAKDSKPYMFYPHSSSHLTYSLPHQVVKTSPVRSRSPHRRDSETHSEHPIVSLNPYGLDLATKAQLFEHEEARLYSRMNQFKRRHHSEFETQKEKRDVERYHLTPDEQYHGKLAHNMTHLSYLLKKQESERPRFNHYSSAFSNLSHEREKQDYLLQRKEEYYGRTESTEKLNGFIDLASTRSRSVSSRFDINEDADSLSGHQQSESSPKQYSPKDDKHHLLPHHMYERRYSSSLYEAGKPPAHSPLPHSYMYRRFSPMVDASTQTSSEREKSDCFDLSRKQHIWSHLNQSNPYPIIHTNGENIKVEKSHSNTSSPISVKDHMSTGSPEVFSGSSEVFSDSRISTPNSITHPLTPLSTPSQCKCGCMSSQIETLQQTGQTNGTVVVYPKEVY